MSRTAAAAAAAAAAAVVLVLYLKQQQRRGGGGADEESPASTASADVSILGDIFCDIMVASSEADCNNPPLIWGGDVVVDEPIQAMAGGSGLNTATHLACAFRSSANSTTNLWSAIGRDAWGGIIRRHASRCGVRLRGVLDAPSTGVCVVFSGPSDRGFVTHRGPIADLALASCSDDEKAVLVDDGELLRTTARHVHVAGYYNCPRLWGGPTASVLKAARARGLTTSLNAQYDASGQCKLLI